MNTTEATQRIREDPDFVALKRFDYSLEAVIERYPDGCPDRVIAQALMISEVEVEELYQKAIVKIQLIMGVEK